MIVIQRGCSVPLTWKHGNEPAVLIAGTVNKCPTDIKSFMESWRSFLAPEFPLNPELPESWFLKSPKPGIISDAELDAMVKEMSTFTFLWPIPEGKEVSEITINVTYDASSLKD